MRLIEYTINDKKGLYEFDVAKIFNEEAQARKYAEEHDIPIELAVVVETLREEEIKPEKRSKIQVIMVDWRVGRLIMFFMITASVTYGLNGTWQEVLYAGAIGTLVSFSGFFLDYLLDSEKDKKSGKLTNPIAKGSLHFITAVFLILFAWFSSIILTIFTSNWILIPIFILSMIIIFQGIFNFMNTPIVRAITLGILQGLYVLIGIN